MGKSGRVVTLGEALIDMVATRADVPLPEAPSFTPAPGGAPANVAVGVARLGGAASFLGQVGNDAWGHHLAATLHANGVDTRGLRFTDEARTALAFVSLHADGERTFLFYRHPSADMLYRPQDVNPAVIAEAAVLHIGSLSLSADPARSATRHALALARQWGTLVSYDPNLRLSLWPDEQTARETVLSCWQDAHLIKVSADELRFLAHDDQLARAAQSLWHDDLRLLAVTLGQSGCGYHLATDAGVVTGQVQGFSVPSRDTTGAGDSWVAALLASVARDPAVLTSAATLVPVLRRANAAAALTTTRRGAIPALPTLAEVTAMSGERTHG